MFTPRRARPIGILLAAALASSPLLLASCGSPPEPESPSDIVSKDQFETEGKVWPLSVASVRVGCTPNTTDRRGDALWFEAPGGTQRYGLNSYASVERGFADLTPIWLEDDKLNAEMQAAFPGETLPTRNRLSIADLAERAQAICYGSDLPRSYDLQADALVAR